MAELEALKEQAGRYKRLSENEDFKKTMEELSAEFKFDESVFRAFNATHPSEYILAREGARTFYQTLIGLPERFESLVNHMEKQPKGEENE